MASKMSQWSQPFTPWPDAPGSEYNLLEPYFNPAYEGTGWPGAGFGIQRKRAVPLPAGISISQTAAQGYSDIEPKMARVNPQGVINRLSDRYSRGVVASLGSLAYYPVRDAMDYRLSQALKGFAQAQDSGVWAAVQSAANALSLDISSNAPGMPRTSDIIMSAVSGAVPQTLVDKVTAKLISDDALVIAAYKRIQDFKRLPAQYQPANLAQLQRDQEEAFSKVNSAKYYALLLPDFQKSLGFASGSPKVVPPDYTYIRSRADSSVSAKVAQWIREQTVQSATKALMDKGYLKGSLSGLGEPVTLTATTVTIIVVAICALVAFLSWSGTKLLDYNLDKARQDADAKLDEDYRAGRLTFEQYTQAKNLQIEADKSYSDRKRAGTTQWDKVVMYGGIAVGALVALRLAMFARDTLQASRAAIPDMPL